MAKGPKLSKPTGLDYTVMIGGPLLFLALAILGIRSLLGSTGPDDPVKLLRNGVVKVGMSQQEVESKVGLPKYTMDRESGGITFRYQHGTWDVERKQFMEEDAFVDFTADGTVSSISFDSKVPEQAK